MAAPLLSIENVTTTIQAANPAPPPDAPYVVVETVSSFYETQSGLPVSTSSSDTLLPVGIVLPVSTSSRISTSPRISTSRISTSSPTSTSSSLPPSPLQTSPTPVFPTIHPTSPTPLPGGLSTSAKIGIGLGVPLGVIVLAIVAFLGYLYGRKRGNERNTIPAADEQFHGFPGDKDLSAMQRQGGAGAVGPQQSDDNGGLPRYAEELQGSPGVKRHELPAQREAKGYFSPDVVTS